MNPLPARTAADLAFAEFRRTASAPALAAAFDATAPELLRVAAFLVPANEVEDLVHDTFAAALSRQERYDAARPLLPWLLGILANEARGRRRQARMRRHEAASRLPAAPLDPAIVASQRETNTALAAALAGLDRDDRELLQLHLLQEFNCRQIAERLRRPQGTVRSQVARAMSELRRRLPVGLAVAPNFALHEASRLPALRSRVLALAPAPPAAAAAISVGRRVVMVTAAVLLGWAVFVSRPTTAGSAAPPVPATAVVPALPSVANERAFAGADPNEVAAGVRVAVATPAPPWQLQGVVREPSGAPIAGATVCCRVRESGPVLATAASDADGRYQLDLSYWRPRSGLDRSRYGVCAVAAAPGHCGLIHAAAFPSSAVPEAALQLQHDFVLDSFPTLRGRVFDAHGRPLPALVLAFAVGGEDLLDTTTADADGSFRIVAATATRRVRLEVTHAEAGRCRAEFDLQAGQEVDAGDLVLDGGYGLVGRVTLSDGSPVSNFEVNVSEQPPGGDGLPQVGLDYWYWSTRTDAEGCFRGCRPALTPWRVWLPRVMDAKATFAAGPVPIAAAADRCDLVLDGVLLRCSWTDADGRELLPQATRMLVFDLEHGADAVAARAGDAAAAKRAIDVATLAGEPHLVPPGATLWLQATAVGGYGIDELVRLPARAQVVDLPLRFARVTAAELTVNVRFDDGSVPDDFTCEVRAAAGAIARDSEVIEQVHGQWRGRCAVGPVRVLVSGHESWRENCQEERTMTSRAGADNRIDVVLARRGRVQLLLRDLEAPQRVVESTEGELHLGSVPARRFFWQQDGTKDYWGNPPIGRPVEAFALLPIGRHEVRVEMVGYQPASVMVDVGVAPPSPTVVWLQPK